MTELRTRMGEKGGFSGEGKQPVRAVFNEKGGRPVRGKEIELFTKNERAKKLFLQLNRI